VCKVNWVNDLIRQARGQAKKSRLELQQNLSNAEKKRLLALVRNPILAKFKDEIMPSYYIASLTLSFFGFKIYLIAQMIIGLLSE